MNSKSNSIFLGVVFLMSFPSIAFGMESANTGLLDKLHELHGAINNHDLAKVKKLIQEDPQLANCPDQFSNYPLHIGVRAYNDVSPDNLHLTLEESDCKRRAQEAILQALLESHANPNVHDADRKTPVDLLDSEAPFLFSINEKVFRSGTAAHVLLLRYGGKSTKQLQEKMKAQKKSKKGQKRKRR